MALIDNINDGFKQLATLIKGKVNKTDVIAVAQGGTGAANVATARSNLGLGTAATATLTTSVSDTTTGRVLKVGDFGYGLKQIASRYDDTVPSNSLGSGFFCYNGYSKQKPIKTGSYDVYGMAFASDYMGGTCTLWFPAYNSSAKQICLRIPNFGTFIDYYFYTTQNMPSEDVQVKSINAGAASYKKGWRKLATTLPSQAGEVTLAHGVTTVETVQAKVTNSDGIIIYNNDIDPTNQFYVRVNGANLVLGVTANSTKVFGQSVTIYVGEEL